MTTTFSGASESVYENFENPKDTRKSHSLRNADLTGLILEGLNAANEMLLYETYK